MVAAVKAGRSVYRCTLADLIEALNKAEREGRLAEKIRFYIRASLLIVDEIGYLRINNGGGNPFFQLVNARYEKGAMIPTSNRGFAEWGEIFGDPVVATAPLDCLLHHAVVVQIEGASYRLGNHADLLPEHTRSHAALAPPPLPKRRYIQITRHGVKALTAQQALNRCNFLLRRKPLAWVGQIQTRSSFSRTTPIHSDGSATHYRKTVPPPIRINRGRNHTTITLRHSA